MTEWTQGPVDPLAERLAVENAKKHRASGSRPMSIGERVSLSPRDDFWWWLHLSRLAMRILIDESAKRGRSIDTGRALDELNNGWCEVLRTFAEAIAEKRGKEQEPDEVAKLSQIKTRFPHGASRPLTVIRKERAVFLSRWFPVPKPGEVGPASWTQTELREIARWLVASVSIESTAWPVYPDGWRESVDQVKAQVEARRR